MEWQPIETAPLDQIEVIVFVLKDRLLFSPLNIFVVDGSVL